MITPEQIREAIRAKPMKRLFPALKTDAERIAWIRGMVLSAWRQGRRDAHIGESRPELSGKPIARETS